MVNICGGYHIFVYKVFVGAYSIAIYGGSEEGLGPCSSHGKGERSERVRRFRLRVKGISRAQRCELPALESGRSLNISKTEHDDQYP